VLRSARLGPGKVASMPDAAVLPDFSKPPFRTPDAFEDRRMYFLHADARARYSLLFVRRRRSPTQEHSSHKPGTSHRAWSGVVVGRSPHLCVKYRSERTNLMRADVTPVTKNVSEVYPRPREGHSAQGSLFLTFTPEISDSQTTVFVTASRRQIGISFSIRLGPAFPRPLWAGAVVAAMVSQSLTGLGAIFFLLLSLAFISRAVSGFRHRRGISTTSLASIKLCFLLELVATLASSALHTAGTGALVGDCIYVDAPISRVRSTPMCAAITRKLPVSCGEAPLRYPRVETRARRAVRSVFAVTLKK